MGSIFARQTSAADVHLQMLSEAAENERPREGKNKEVLEKQGEHLSLKETIIASSRITEDQINDQNSSNTSSSINEHKMNHRNSYQTNQAHFDGNGVRYIKTKSGIGQCVQAVT